MKKFNFVVSGLLILSYNQSNQFAKTFTQLLSGSDNVLNGEIITSPIINTITCINMGKQTSYNPALFSGYFIGDTESNNSLTIEGTGFGLEGRAATKGTILLVGSSSFYITAINSWTDNKIVVTFKTHYSAIPIKVKIILTTAGNLPQTVMYNFNIAPAIKTHQYGECTWWVAKRRKEQSKSIPWPAYSDPNYKMIDANYEPKVDDVWKWNSDHQVFVENVRVKIIANLKYPHYIYEINFSESNGDQKGTPNIWHTTKVEIDQINSNTRKIISGTFGKADGAPATHYFR